MSKDLVSIVSKKASTYDYMPTDDIIYGDSGCTRLMNAVYHRVRADTVKNLIEQDRSSLWARTSSGMTVVHIFVRSYMNEHNKGDYYGKYVRKHETDYEKVLNTLALFAEEPGLIDSPDNNGNTPLSLCCRDVLVSVERICAFVELGANINAANKDGITLLHKVFTKNHMLEKIHYAVVDNGANVNAITNDGNSVLTLLARDCDTTCVDVGLHTKECKTNYFVRASEYLVSKGANINHRNKNGETALHIHVKKHDDEHKTCVIDKLVRLGADTSLVDNAGYSVDLLLMPYHKRLYRWLKSYVVSEDTRAMDV